MRSSAEQSGVWKARWLRRVRFALRYATLGALVLLAAACVAWIFLPKPDLYRPDLDFSEQVFDRNGNLLHLTLTTDGKYRLRTDLNSVSPDLIAATLEKEDRRYYAHAGVDVKAVIRAAWGAASGQRLGGGSTLTMQYSRLRWNLNTRSLWGKCAQMFRAVQLERHYSKRELLEAYLSLAPYGANVEGAVAASWIWCGKPPQELSQREAAALAVLPQSPTARSPRSGPNPSLASAQARLLTQLRGQSSELDTQFVLQPSEPPRKAPHLSRRLVSATAGAAAIQTCIDANAQQAVERSIAEFLARSSDKQLCNACAILVHAPTREVRAYVGSASFLDEAIDGQVDGVTARRSPGSALKPFIYALALDAGLIHPATLLDDASRQFASYNPENSDRAFAGPLPAAEALRRSRNVPAVELLARLPDGGLDAFLRASDVHLDKAPGAYGLSLALGGAELSLEELASLYAALATDGIPRPLRFTTSASVERSPSPNAALLSPAARWMTLDALRDPRSHAPSGLAWKTGTSHGFRDTWACGVLGDWVLCVWIGNFDGKPMPGLFARETAAPLLFETAVRLRLSGKLSTPPANVVRANLCSESGMVAAPCCPHTRQSALIAGVSPIAVCDVHREIFLNAHGERVRAGHRDAFLAVREFWPQHRLDQFRRAGLPRLEPPPWAEGEEGASFGTPPHIVSPQAALTYVLRPEKPENRVIPLEARAAPGVRRIHWFAGPQYVGSSPPGQAFLWEAPPGRWTIKAADDSGYSAQVTITVTSVL